jgi:hypothetical protein
MIPMTRSSRTPPLPTEHLAAAAVRNLGQPMMENR